MRCGGEKTGKIRKTRSFRGKSFSRRGRRSCCAAPSKTPIRRESRQKRRIRAARRRENRKDIRKTRSFRGKKFQSPGSAFVPCGTVENSGSPGIPSKTAESMRRVGEKTGKHALSGKADRNSFVAIRFQHGVPHHRCALRAVQHRRKFRFAGNPVKNGGIHATQRRENRKNPENTPVRGKADRNGLVTIRFQHGVQHHRCTRRAVRYCRKFRFAGNPVKKGRIHAVRRRENRKNPENTPVRGKRIGTA